MTRGQARHFFLFGRRHGGERNGGSGRLSNGRSVYLLLAIYSIYSVRLGVNKFPYQITHGTYGFVGARESFLLVRTKFTLGLGGNHADADEHNKCAEGEATHDLNN